jgi:phosphate transport system substrate-binding protein
MIKFINYILQYNQIVSIYFMAKNLTYYLVILLIGDRMRKPIAALLIFLLVGTIATTMAVTEVTVSGSTTVGPLGALCAEAFNSAQKDYHVSVAQTGTGAGLTAIATGTADVAMASREVTSDEKTKYPEKQFQETLIGYDGITICVSKPIYDAGVTALTKEQVKDIYSGNIKNWKELGGPDELIFAVSREIGSGTRDTFLEDIFGDKKAETPGVNSYLSQNADIKTAITGSDKAIGYLGYSFSQSGDLAPIKLDGVLPSPETVKDKTYAMARGLYLDTFGDASAGAQAFIDFCKGPEGQQIASENGYIPL